MPSSATNYVFLPYGHTKLDVVVKMACRQGMENNYIYITSHWLTLPPVMISYH